ncbi:DUF937 domain-containing protein [Limnoraphis robusta]|uniref:DUF937 domain-containing protein n=2 Tax=Limnoraphis robusta TaxID=1118279 RepID=A0A0F5YHS5_9CYAN|nr:DUF937 domain-containing protein [Limnoraphis robusta]KKD38308.1 hypothetical protein WN50_09580 [Limnoraphis robusta CS-951]MEA5517850.1 DUF937 domain-containing protein [Limnoraphis robusta CCNP1315]MEA5546344.1 DUF937 domain-containing protein [Limnoraphis robusta CCNP1324]
MGLFDQIVGALNDPNQEASNTQLDNILSTVQQLTNNQGISSDTTQTALSVLGGYVRSALQQKRTNQGNESVEAFVNQYSGTGQNSQAVSSLFSPEQQAQVAQTISSRTGIDAGTIQSLLPALVPLVLNLLKTGNPTQNPQQSSNSVLSSFLDADQDGDVDVADAMRLAGQFLQNR